jgi:hypothetical protein
MIPLRQSTAVDIPIGPFLDETDGKTIEDGLTITQPDVRLKKNGGNWAQKSAAQTLSHEEFGYYELTLSTTDTDTLGLLKIAVHESGALPVWLDAVVMPANVWDSLFGSDKLQIHADEITNGLITAAAIATNAIDADAVNADAVTKIQVGLATAAALTAVAGYLDTEIAAILEDTGTALPAQIEALEVGGGGVTITRSTGALVGTSESSGVTIDTNASRTGVETDLLGDNSSIGYVNLYLCFTSAAGSTGSLEVHLYLCRVSGQPYDAPDLTFRPAANQTGKIFLGRIPATRYMRADVHNKTSAVASGVAVLYELEKQGG